MLPAKKIDGQAFYKVMLETLGYKQDVDFTYAETLEFAEEIGLVDDAGDIEKIKSFTVNDIAIGIYNALNTKPADSDKKLISVMVENNIIDSEDAVAAGFALDAKKAGVVSFNAVSNTKIQVEFEEEILLAEGRCGNIRAEWGFKAVGSVCRVGGQKGCDNHNRG
ncbi:MAG: hypothetical protein ACOX3L_03000 [Lutisporaceae bacterium]